MSRLLSTAALALALTVGAALFPAAVGAVSETPPPTPPNDELANAQAIKSLPTTFQGTTVGATVAPQEATSTCGGSTTNSVWYSLRFPTAQRIAIELAAAGALDATVEVFHAVRSQLEPVACQETEAEGKGSLTFDASKNGLYEIRVAARQGSQLAGFTLNAFLPTPAINPPGSPLPASGASGQVDRIQNINAAYSLTLHAGVSYLINLTNRTRKGACVSGTLFSPGTTSFELSSALLRIECGGYQLFTPGPGRGGLYSFEVTPSSSYAGVQRFRLQAAPAGADETAPGVALGNYGVARGRLDGQGVQVLRLYRLDVTSHSNLTLRLSAPASADFNLRLLDQNGQQIECQCGASGSQKLQHQLRAGRYYVAVSVRNGSAGDFTLERESRTITHTAVYFAGAIAHAGRATVGSGRETPIHVRVTPAAAGPVTVDIQRFDPVFGWQFYRQVRVDISEGIAAIPFTAPTVGRWRVNATYTGSRVSSPSAVGFSYLLVH